MTLSGMSWSGSGWASQEARVRDPRGWLDRHCCLCPAEDGLGSRWVLGCRGAQSPASPVAAAAGSLQPVRVLPDAPR